MLYDVIVIGGGPAGLAAALEAREYTKNVLILERNSELGGILNQCIHNGFGLHYFKEELTGPEYAARFIEQVEKTDIEVMTDTMVLDISADKTLHAMNSKNGYMELSAKAIVLTMGCRERTRGAIAIPGTRCAGVLTAGAAQLFVNTEGYMIGRRVVILGSGDIGLIMARRMVLEGAEVLGVFELMPYSNGLNRNIVQCLDDYNIPLYLSHTITQIRGKDRVEQVVVSRVDENRAPIPGSELVFDCDTVLLSVGLIPENELSSKAGVLSDKRTGGLIVYENMETSIDGIFACGNVVHVHDLVDFVTAESKAAGKAAGCYAAQPSLRSKAAVSSTTKIINGNGVTYTVPQHIRKENIEKYTTLFFRVNSIYKDALVHISSGEKIIASFRREHMAPGEMEKIILSKELLKQIENNKITVLIETKD